MNLYELNSLELDEHLTAYAADLKSVYWAALDGDVVDWPTVEGALARLRAAAMILGVTLAELT